MMICNRCKHVFHEDDADTRPELVGEFWGSPAYDEIDICPECGSDDLEEIEQPYEECDENEDCDGKCENCPIARKREEEEDDDDT